MAASGQGQGPGPVSARTRLPPGQAAARNWPVVHYGPVPKFKPATWDFQVFGATASGEVRRLDHEEFFALPRSVVCADMHCVTKFSVRDVTWSGIPAAAVLAAAPPAPDVRHVMVFAEYGYSANIRIGDFAAGQTIFATRRGGEPLTPETGFPVRLVVPHLYAWKGPKWVRGVEYLTSDRRGFWEERGYHNVGDAWRAQRYAYQEAPGDGPEF
ncbi:MAG: molybdopterin-dependent oxidoreductase [Carbonactinosporaceae bacterium]